MKISYIIKCKIFNNDKSEIYMLKINHKHDQILIFEIFRKILMHILEI